MKDKRSAEVPAEVLQAEFVFLVSEEIRRVETIIAHEAVPTAVKVLCSALRDDGNLRSSRFSELGIVGIRDDLELFDGVDAHVVHLRGVGAGVEILGTVEREAGKVLSEAVDLLPVGAEARAAFITSFVAGDARHQRHQLHVRSAVNGQLLGLLARDEMRHVGTR